MLSAILSAALGTAQFSIPPLPPNGQQVVVLSDGGGSREEVQVSWIYKIEQDSPPMSLQNLCYRRCAKKKHVSHEKCDTSCDSPCGTDHFLEGFPASFQLHSMTKDDFLQAGRKFGLQGDALYAAASGVRRLTGLSAYEQDGRLRSTRGFQHWNDNPCSVQAILAASIVVVQEVTSKFTRVTTKADGTIVRTPGPEGVNVNRIEIPDLSRLTMGKPVVRCLCDPVMMAEEEKLLGWAYPPVVQDGEVAMTNSSGETTICTPDQREDMDFEVVCTDMNHATLTLGSMPAGVTEVSVPAGYEFDCVDGSAQDTQLIQDLKFRRASLTEPMVASIAPMVATQALHAKISLAAQTTCLEIVKKEPNKKLKYRLRPPSNLKRLLSARMAAKASRRGLDHQVRTWIVTDSATLPQMENVLVPPPTNGMYLRELRNANLISALDFRNKKTLAMYDSELLSTPGVDEETLKSFWEVKSRYDREETLKWVKTLAGKSFAEWYDQTPAPPTSTRLGELISGLCEWGDEGILAAAELLVAKELDPHRGIVSEIPETNMIASRLTSKCDGKLADAIVKALEKNGLEGARFALLNADKSLSSALRARLAKIQ